MRTRHLANRQGFTLIELAVVLVIIGLILGAVMKGRDLIQSAQVKNFYSGFLGKWYSIGVSYYDRTGKRLSGAVDTTMISTLKKVGINPKTLIKSPDPTKREIAGEYAAGNVTLTFSKNSDGLPTLVAASIPTDVAVALDKIIDGSANGTQGTFIRGDSAADWPDANGTTTVTGNWTLDI
ncbi:prepilin-type N-terminal cleavage/methylation domain-containing protein [Dissulfurirhabdus thermomarina]|uniref:Prepilin-type N-terminal cleavage/methylation domain-containing protein n=1 Tax=Dissulfurirhabdus thermomarina TaxID=1765737 RepID=A0A6N9TLJ7_DISTH|nr:prepilin-type N-terminal cleavage/methylation domain-containing protein [Dissulfurirhabdus thermomarina]NDY42105.1 prepilin-type N-terminal cleavage/methylation domain-containing protein [Dissulfurirhabdus thermomarina]NMX22483.1 prepilin-type N-terminal cleavage/methylation domain-containing protein [Dissulfurirhabdus thermomarina]